MSDATDAATGAATDAGMADGSGLFRVVYRSRHAPGAPGADVEAVVGAILAASRRRNAEAGITGSLMVTGPFFVQALEGPAAAVEATFDRICCDLRHVALEVVECGPVLERAFGEWSMSHVAPDDAPAAPGAEPDAEVDAAAAAMRLLASLVRSLPERQRERRAG